MKRILTSAIALFILFSVQASAQAKWGVTAGMNFNTSKFSELDVKARAGWNVGVTALLDLPLGFSIQPSVVYNQKGANIVSSKLVDASQTMGFLEVPVSVQWGPDLLVFRPFVDVTPYVGYAISNKYSASVAGIDVSGNSEKWEGLQRFEYGVGIGGGINVWRLQAVVRYCWNLGSLYNVDGWDDIKDQIPDLNKESRNFGGVQAGVSFFF